MMEIFKSSSSELLMYLIDSWVNLKILKSDKDY